MRTTQVQASRPGTSQGLGGGFKKDPNLHYVLVEKDPPLNSKVDYTSPIEEMQDRGYSIVTEDQKVTGNRRKVLMAIDKAIYTRRQRATEEEAEARTKRRSETKSDQGEVFEQVEDGKPANLATLGAMLPDQPAQA